LDPEAVPAVDDEALGAGALAVLGDRQVHGLAQRVVTPHVERRQMAQRRVVACVQQRCPEPYGAGHSWAAPGVHMREDALELTPAELPVDDRTRDGAEQLDPRGDPTGRLQLPVDDVRP